MDDKDLSRLGDRDGKLIDLHKFVTLGDLLNAIDGITVVFENHIKQYHVRKKSPPKTYAEGDIEYDLAQLLLVCILSRKPSFKTPNKQQWCKDISLMLGQDKRNPETIKSVILWCQSDVFWCNNILSPAKLRKQFDQLELKMMGETAPKVRKPEPVKLCKPHKRPVIMTTNGIGSCCPECYRQQLREQK